MSYYVPPVERRRTSPIGNAFANMGEAVAQGITRRYERQEQTRREAAAQEEKAQEARNRNRAAGMIEGPAPTRPGMFQVPGIGPMQQPRMPGPIGNAFGEDAAPAQPGLRPPAPPQLQMPPSLQGGGSPVHRAFTQEANPDFYEHKDASGVWYAPTPQARARQAQQEKEAEKLNGLRAEYASLTGQRMPDVGGIEEAAQLVGEAKHAWNTRERQQNQQLSPYQQHQIGRQAQQDDVTGRIARLVGPLTRYAGNAPIEEILEKVDAALTPNDRRMGITAQRVAREAGYQVRREGPAQQGGGDAGKLAHQAFDAAVRAGTVEGHVSLATARRQYAQNLRPDLVSRHGEAFVAAEIDPKVETYFKNREQARAGSR
jgi:hypothetical protein